MRTFLAACSIALILIAGLAIPFVVFFRPVPAPLPVHAVLPATQSQKTKPLFDQVARGIAAPEPVLEEGKGKIIVITGKVEDGGLKTDQGLFDALEQKPDAVTTPVLVLNWKGNTIYCTFLPEQASRLAEVNRGERVTVEGRLDRHSSLTLIKMSECRLK